MGSGLATEPLNGLPIPGPSSCGVTRDATPADVNPPGPGPGRQGRRPAGPACRLCCASGAAAPIGAAARASGAAAHYGLMAPDAPSHDRAPGSRCVTPAPPGPRPPAPSPPPEGPSRRPGVTERDVAPGPGRLELSARGIRGPSVNALGTTNVLPSKQRAKSV